MSTPNTVADVLNLSERIGTKPAEVNVLSRALGILFNPEAAWAQIREEEGGLVEAFYPYSLVMALIPFAVGAVLSAILMGFLGAMGGTEMAAAGGLMGGIFHSVAYYAEYVIAVLVFGKLAEIVAGTKGARQSWVLSCRVLVYANTPATLAGVLVFIPFLGSLVWLAGFVWSIRLMIQGFRIVLKK